MPKYQPSLPPMLLANETRVDAVRAKDTSVMPAPSPRANDTQDDAPRPKCTPAVASVHAAELFDEALIDARITTAEVAYLLSVSESLVRRMRSKDARERVSFAQMLLLPPAFHWALHKSMSTRYGYGRKALTDLLEAAGRIAMVIG